MPNFSPNHLNYAPNTDNNQNETLSDNNQNEILSDKQRLARIQNEIGSKVLTLVGFESRNKDIVNSSFEKARKQKEKLPGKNNERRNFAYLSRLDNMVEKHGDALEQKLWAASAENLVMDYEDIPDAYWRQQEQILRDNGQGRELSRNEKETLAEDLIEKQRESINTWSNYLGDKDCPYPLWFKVYAFDGVSKMGLINKETKEFEKRDKSTVASFPILNPEVLAKVYRNINEFYGVDKEDWLAQHPDDEKLVSLVKSGNFPKLYAKELFETKTIIKTPEKPEDIEGDWFTYQLGDEDELAKTAEGTGWCIADPNVAHNYLEYGNYGHSRNEETDEESSSKAEFIIFKLKAPNSPDGYSTNGVASIRLDPDGKVTEVSGLNEGQAIEDSLIPTVKEKVLSLPGGKEFLQKFEDKQTLIKLDHKLQKGEDLTKEELSFLYELDRPIATLDTYNNQDPRIKELREKYGIEYVLEKGIDVNELASRLNPNSIVHNLDIFLEHGADIDNIVSNLDPQSISYNLDTLLEHGADIDVNKLVSNLARYAIVDNLDTLLEHGADIDVNKLVSNLDPEYIAYALNTLLRNGADINVNELVSNIGSGHIAFYLDDLLRNGADINNVIKKMDKEDIEDNIDLLREYGAKLDTYQENN